MIIFIGATISILGISGLIIWFWDFVSNIKEKRESSEAAIKSWWQVAKGIDILLILGLLFRFFVIQPYIVEGNSMEPNFHDKEYILVNQLSYRIESPKRGDTIIFKYPRDPSQEFIKRIIGLPGETIEIADGLVKVNNKLIDENYLPSDQKTLADGQKNIIVILNNDEYFVMGDNRDHSSDSREFGPLNRKYFIGKAWFGVYPFKIWGVIKRPEISMLKTIYLNNLMTSSSDT